MKYLGHCIQSSGNRSFKRTRTEKRLIAWVDIRCGKCKRFVSKSSARLDKRHRKKLILCPRCRKEDYNDYHKEYRKKKGETLRKYHREYLREWRKKRKGITN